MGDWTTWDGLNDAPDEAWEDITFGERKETKPKAFAKGAKKAPTHAKPQKLIAKKAPRAAGLMKV